MTKTPQHRSLLLHSVIFSLAVFGLVNPTYSQPPARDTTYHPYYVNRWVTGGIIATGITTEYIGQPLIANKLPVSNTELQSLDRDDLNAIDRWALNLDPSKIGYYANLSDNVLSGVVLLPALTLLDRDARKDWLDLLLMYSETIIITNNIYLYSPIGPSFHSRLRPVVYYEALGNGYERTTAFNRNSFYSGHVASAASASFFTAKVICDYNPELGWKKYLVYGAAAVPPLIVGYLRFNALFHFPSDLMVGFGVGALCGILIPELHRIRIENISMGVYSGLEGAGITMRWQPDFLK